MYKQTAMQKVVQLFIKGDDYDTLCPNDEDTWYTPAEVMKQPRLLSLLESGTLQNLKDGKIDYVVCRGNW